MSAIIAMRATAITIVVSLVLIVLKVVGVISLSWWWAGLPFWIYFGFAILVAVMLSLCMLLVLLLHLLDEIGQKSR